MSDNAIIQLGVPVRFAWKNFRRGYSDRRGNGVGAVYKIEVEVLAEDWATLETMPRHADGEMVMWVTDVGMEPEKPKREKKAKEATPYGQIWKELHLAGFFNAPGIRESIEAVREDDCTGPHLLMRKVFGVESLSREVGPEQIYARFPADQFPQVQAMVEQARRKVGEKQ